MRVKNDKPKILHVWDIAGVGSIISKYQKKLGYTSRVIKRKSFDKLGITQYYKETLWDTSAKLFVSKAIAEARKYDIIHLHDAWWAIKPIKILYPSKKIILHYHGSFLRETPLSKRKNFEKKVNAILVSTPDLLDFEFFKNPIYLPNPVDIELFSPRNIPKNNQGVSFLKKGMSHNQLADKLKKNGIEIEFESISSEDRNVPYWEMPDFLAKYQFYLDIPIINEKIIPHSTLTGLQALSLGLTVIDYNFQPIETLPEKNRPENVIQQLQEIYDSC